MRADDYRGARRLRLACASTLEDVLRADAAMRRRRGRANERGRAPRLRRRPLAPPARADRLHRRGRSARRPKSTRAYAPAIARFARHPRRAGRRAADAARSRVGAGLSAAAGSGGAAHGRGRVAASRRLHHGDGRGRGQRRRRDADRIVRRPRARPRLRQQRRRHRASIWRRHAFDRPRRDPAHGLAGLRSTAASRSTHARRCAASPPRAGAGAASRSASPTRSPCSPRRASAADAAATMIANAVDVDDPAHRAPPAGELDRDDSDLGDLRLVTAPSARCAEGSRRSAGPRRRRGPPICAGRIIAALPCRSVGDGPHRGSAALPRPARRSEGRMSAHA